MASPPTTIRPSSGSVSPAMQSSSVVLPAPDAPNRIVKPASARKWTFSRKPPSGFGKRLRMRTSSSEEVPMGEAGGDKADFTSTDPPPTNADSFRTQSTAEKKKLRAEQAPF